MTEIIVAALQLALGGSAENNIAAVSGLVREAAGRGAQVILPPELFEGPYFCRVEDEGLFATARPVDAHPSVRAMRVLAAELGVTIPTSFFEADGPHHYNSLAMIGPDGAVQGVYRKSHIPDGPGYEEKFYFRPGNTGFKVWPAAGTTVGVGVCWDQWYPETARAMLLMGAEVLFYPTAIGSEPHDTSLDTARLWRRRDGGPMPSPTWCRWSPPTGSAPKTARPSTAPASSATSAATCWPSSGARRRASLPPRWISIACAATAPRSASSAIGGRTFMDGWCRMSDGRTAWLNGAYLPLADARVPVTDRGFLFADGVYEVTAVLDRRLVDSAAHLARLERSAAEIGIALPLAPAAIEAIERELIARNDLDQGTVYLQLTRGGAERDFLSAPDLAPTLLLFTQAKDIIGSPAAREGIAVRTMPDQRWARRDIKSVMLLAQVLAKREAAASGAAEAWLVEDGVVTEGASSTALIVAADGTLVTRGLSNAILPGCTRRAVLALAERDGLRVGGKGLQARRGAWGPRGDADQRLHLRAAGGADRRPAGRGRPAGSGRAPAAGIVYRGGARRLGA